MKRLTTWLTIVLLGMLLVPLATNAASRHQAVSQVKAEYGNRLVRVIKVDTKKVKGRCMHVVRIVLKGNRVQHANVPAGPNDCR